MTTHLHIMPRLLLNTCSWRHRDNFTFMTLVICARRRRCMHQFELVSTKYRERSTTNSGGATDIFLFLSVRFNGKVT
jgi:hypothetical protein